MFNGVRNTRYNNSLISDLYNKSVFILETDFGEQSDVRKR